MGLTELPSELFRMKHVKTLCLGSNVLCSLPSEIAQFTTLEFLRVLRRRQIAITLTHVTVLFLFSSTTTSCSRSQLSSVCSPTCGD
jgi:uncharacterized membrane protein YcfT